MYNVLTSWQHSALYALAVMFVFTATAHFNKMKHDLAPMIPLSFPRPPLIVYITGVLELLGAAGLVLPQFRRLAGICLIVLLVGMFIANVNAAQRGVVMSLPQRPHLNSTDFAKVLMVMSKVAPAAPAPVEVAETQIRLF